MRGLAAVCVVLGHLTLALPVVANASRADGWTFWNVALYSPFHMLFEGGAAVVVFFVLSGFVLAVSYEGGRQTYGGFLLRRIARIYIPYLVAVVAGMLLATALGQELVPGASSWFNARWQDAVSFVPALQHVLLVSHYRDDAQYVPVIWSLTDEMRISLIFPLLIAAVAVVGWSRAVLASIVLTGIGLALARKLSHDFATLEYVICFVVGIALAEHRATITAWLTALGRSKRVWLFLAAVVLFTWDSWLASSWLPGRADRVLHSEGTHIVLQTAAAATFIALAQVPGPVHELLLTRIPQYLGRISYSLYLVHTIVLLTLVHLVDDHVALGWLLVPAFAISIAVADLMQRWVERPAQRLGRGWARRVEGDAPQPAVSPAS